MSNYLFGKTVKASKKNVVGLLTVRALSTRLPKKCLLPFGDGNVLNHVIRRARFYGLEPIVCTSVDSSDDLIEKIAINEGAKCFRGSLINKLKRWSDCAAHFGLTDFHTVDVDDPFFDGEEMLRSMNLLRKMNFDMVCPTISSSNGGASVGYSLTYDLVKRVVENLPDETNTEMIWYFLESEPGLRYTVLSEQDYVQGNIRLTLDYQEDYWLLESVRRVIGNLATRSEVNKLFQRNPDLHKINWFRNEEWKAGQSK
jgi:spore coat polysaccharide biosynthesis protein SpsF